LWLNQVFSERDTLTRPLFQRAQRIFERSASSIRLSFCKNFSASELHGMMGRSGFRQMGAAMGAMALVVQGLIPFILALELWVLTADPSEHVRHVAAVTHLQPHRAAARVERSKDEHTSAAHAAALCAACPLCLILHASLAILAAEVTPPPGLPRDGKASGPAMVSAPGSGCPASYQARAPPGSPGPLTG
jgi:hypothetical protein